MIAACIAGSAADFGDSLLVAVTPPQAMLDGFDAVWTVSWEGGTPPFTVSINLGEGADSGLVVDTTDASPYSRTFPMLGSVATGTTDYTYEFTVTDSRGLTGIATGPFTVGQV